MDNETNVQRDMQKVLGNFPSHSFGIPQTPPEKPDKSSNPSRCIDNSTREHTITVPHPPAMDPASPEQRRPRIPNTSPARGLEGLSHMEKTAPTSNREKTTAPDNFESVRRRVEVDIAELDLTRIQITKTNRFPSKMKPTKALAQLPSIEAMSDVYKTTYEIYLKRFNNKLLQNINPKSKPGKRLNALCQTLNIDKRSKENQDLPNLLARLRASGMMNFPEMPLLHIVVLQHCT